MSKIYKKVYVFINELFLGYRNTDIIKDNGNIDIDTTDIIDLENILNWTLNTYYNMYNTQYISPLITNYKFDQLAKAGQDWADLKNELDLYLTDLCKNDISKFHEKIQIICAKIINKDGSLLDIENFKA